MQVFIHLIMCAWSQFWLLWEKPQFDVVASRLESEPTGSRPLVERIAFVLAVGRPGIPT